MEDILNYSIGGYTVAKLLYAILILLLCIVVVKILMTVLRKILGKSHLETGVRSFTLSLSKILLYFVAVVIVADFLGIPVSSLLAVFSIAGLAASLAMQDSLSNLASGVMILITKPFKVGDYIECGATSGIVHDISLVYTSLTTIDNRIIFVPNKDISAARITNYSHEELRRIDLKFTASYDAKTESVKGALMDAASRVDGILKEPAPFAALNAYQSSSIEYILRVWVKNSQYWDVYFPLMEQVRESFAAFGVEMSYDHMNVHIVEK